MASVASRTIEIERSDRQMSTPEATRRARALLKKLRRIDYLLTLEASELTAEQQEKVNGRCAITEQLALLQITEVDQVGDPMPELTPSSSHDPSCSPRTTHVYPGKELANVDENAQMGGYVVKNTFLTLDAPKSSFFRMHSCPGTISNEPTKDSLPEMDMRQMDAPELDDTSSNAASDVSLADVACLGTETKWQRMQTEDPCWGQAEPQQFIVVENEDSSSGQAEPQQFNVAENGDFAQENANFTYDSAQSTATPGGHGGYAPTEGYTSTANEGMMAPVMMPIVYPVPPCAGELSELDGKPTVMMRNLPNKYTRNLLLEELGRTGFNGTYDFLYIPIDASTQANKGYAFINFISPAVAKTFKEIYDDCTMPLFNSSKSIAVTPASLQGFEANYAHYANARCNKGDPAARPLFLREYTESMKPWTRRRPLKLQKRSAPAEAKPEESVKVQSGAKFCASCGAGGQLGHRFCSECGHALIRGD